MPLALPPLPDRLQTLPKAEIDASFANADIKARLVQELSHW